MLVPNGGEMWRVGTTQKIEWFCDTDADYFLVFYYGKARYDIATVAGNLRSYNWVIPNRPYDQCEVWVWAVWGMAEGGDYSDKYFYIYSGSLYLSVPNGGERWKGGTLQDIKWTYTGNIPYVRLYYSYNYGMNWTMIASKIPTANGKLSWSVPHVNSDYCYVKVADDGDQYYNDRSDNVFTIYSENGFSKPQDKFLPSNPCLSVYPNPINRSSKVYYTITKASFVDFSLFSMDGRQVWTKSLPLMQSGSHTLDIGSIQAENGVYLLRMKANEYEITRKVAIIK